jgi:hypothetical protein
MGMFKFDKEKLEEQASRIVQKSGELMESGKIRYNIAHLEREINTFKSELGHTLYKAYKDGSSFQGTGTNGSFHQAAAGSSR